MKAKKRIIIKNRVSIPTGSIKILSIKDFCEPFKVSIPTGSIKIFYNLLKLTENLVSIPTGSIKIIKICAYFFLSFAFQFQLVRLK